MQQQIAAPKRPLIPVTRVESSSIEAYGYNAATKVLQVNFKDKDGKPGGKPYQYDDVPPDLVNKLREAESVGSFINKFIVRGGFKSHKPETLA